MGAPGHIQQSSGRGARTPAKDGRVPGQLSWSRVKNDTSRAHNDLGDKHPCGGYEQQLAAADLVNEHDAHERGQYLVV